MADLATSYMGLKINNPFIAGASELTSDLESIRNIASEGAGAIVVKSLFEEQIQLERLRLEDELTEYDEIHAEMLDIHPDLEHGGPQEHLHWLRKVKEAVDIPVFASLNAINRETWIDYAKQIEGTGVDGIELNFYLTPVDMDRKSADIEKEQTEILGEIKGSLKIPVAVKLSPFYANPLNLVKKMDNAGADGFVLFNRFFQPDIDPQKEKASMEFNLSSEGDHRLPLRYAGLLYGNINADICASSGVFGGMDAVKLLLAGASCVQVVSTLYRNRPDIIGTMVADLSEWMEKKGYHSIDDIKGKLSKKNSSDPFAYERAQYVSMLMRPEPVMRDFPR
jgi:dihydroorotate dehydrogenase (fumarate)